MANKGIKGITIELGAETSQLDKALRDVNTKSKDLQSELKAVDRLLKFDPGNAELVAQKQQILSEQIGNVSEKLNRLKEVQSQVDAQFASGDLGVEQYRAFQREVQATEGQLKGLMKQLDMVDDGNSFQQMAKDVEVAEQSVKDLGGELTGLVSGLAAGGGVAGVLQKALDVSSLDTKIEISMEVPPESTQSVKDAINTVSAYGVDAETALEGVRKQWALNKDASDATNQAVVQAAATITAAYSGLDFNELVQETNEISRALGITNEEALGLTNSLLKVGFPPDQIDIIAEYGTQLAMAGYSAEEVQAIMAAGVETGTWNIDNLLDGLKEGRIVLAEFGNEVPKAVSDLLAGTDISTKQLQEWGKAVAAGGEGGRKAMNEVATALMGVTDEATRNALGVQFFGTMWEDQGANITTTLSTMDQHMMSAAQNQDQLNQATAAMDASPAVQMQQAMADMQTALTPLLTNIAQFVAKVAEWISANPQLAATITAIVTVLGILLGAIIALSPVFIALSTAATALGIGIAPLVGIIAGVVVAFGLLVAAGIAIYKNWDDIWAKTKEIWGNIENFFVTLWQTITQLFQKSLEWINEQTGGKFSEIIETAKKYMNMCLENIKAVWSFIKETFSNTLSFLKSLVTGDFEGMKTAIQNQMENASKLVSTIWGNIKEYFREATADIIKTVTAKFADIVNSVRDKMNDTLSKVKEIWGKVESFFEDIDLKSVGKDIIQGLINGITDKADALWKKVKEIANSIKDTLEDVLIINSPSKATEYVGEMSGAGIVVGMDNMISKIKDMSARMASAAIPSVSNVPTTQSISNSRSYSYGDIHLTFSGADIDKIKKVTDLFDRLPRSVRSQ